MAVCPAVQSVGFHEYHETERMKTFTIRKEETHTITRSSSENFKLGFGFEGVSLDLKYNSAKQKSDNHHWVGEVRFEVPSARCQKCYRPEPVFELILLARAVLGLNPETIRGYLTSLDQRQALAQMIKDSQ